MTTNQEGRQAAIRESTSTAYGVAADWHALFDDAGISAGTFNERLLAWINAELSASYSNLVSAMQAYAEDAGYDGWEDMATLVLAMNGAETLLDGETQGLAFDFTDQSALIIDTGTPANNYDSTGIVAGGELIGPSGKLTYTSPSNKLTLQSDGYIKYQAHNLCVQSESTTSWTTTALTGFANGQADHVGATSAFLVQEDSTASSTHRCFPAAITQVGGATYTWRMYVKWGTGSRNVYLRFDANATNLYAFFPYSDPTTPTVDSGVTATATAVGGGWYLLEARVANATNGAANVIVGLCTGTTSASVTYNGDGASSIYFAHPHYYRYPANTDYIRTTSAAKYALPLEYSATDGSCLGLLVEEQRTNILTYSTDLANAAWGTFSGGAPVSTNNTAPDGTATACRFDWNGTGNDFRYHATTGTSAATVYTLSFFYKRAASSDCVFLSRDSSASGYVSTLHTATSEWQRYSQTFTATAGTDFGFDFRPAVNGGISATGEVLLWGVQIEAGSFPTSLVLTYGSAATRSADNISIATSAFPYSATDGTWYAEVTPYSSTYLNTLIGQTATSIQIMITPPNWGGYDGTSETAIGSFTVNTNQKLALAYGSTTRSGCVNGGSVNDTAFDGSWPTNDIGIGGSPGGGGTPITALIKAVSFVPRVKSDAELQAETA